MSPQDAPGPSRRSVIVAIFDRENHAREAMNAVRALGVDEQQLGLLTTGQHVNVSDTTSADLSTLLALAASATPAGAGGDVANVLQSMGVPDGEARFYAAEASEGRTLVVVQANGRAEEVRRTVLDHGGYDVESRGAELIRGSGAGARLGARPLPMDVTHNWDDFSSRYEMLWQQHYGTTDATWEQMEPVYRRAWELANDRRYRGRAWTQVAAELELQWPPSIAAWRDAAGPVRDVFEDVAEEALTGAEGGADRRIARQGTDQSLAARDVLPPRQGAA